MTYLLDLTNNHSPTPFLKDIWHQKHTQTKLYNCFRCDYLQVPNFSSSPPPGFVYTAGESIFFFTLSLPANPQPLCPPSLNLLLIKKCPRALQKEGQSGCCGEAGGEALPPDVFKITSTPEMLYSLLKQVSWRRYRQMVRGGLKKT